MSDPSLKFGGQWVVPTLEESPDLNRAAHSHELAVTQDLLKAKKLLSGGLSLSEHSSSFEQKLPA